MGSAPRFFVEDAVLDAPTLLLPPDAAHHARRVLRLGKGDPVRLHDGRGNAADGRIVALSAAAVEVEVEGWSPTQSEPRLRVTIAQALPKSAEKLEQVLQHGTEIGAAGFIVFGAARSVARLEAGEKRQKRLARWRSIVRSAAEQSGRGVLPPVEWAEDIRVLGEQGAGALLALHESARTPLRAALPAPIPSRLRLAIGPEGGFTDAEMDTLRQSGAVAVSLGPRILRTETAALAALAQILYASGD